MAGTVGEAGAGLNSGLETEEAGMIAKIIMGLVALGMALAFFAVPILKLKEPALIIVILIGVAMMVYNFIEVVREKDDH
jgi:4-hydroxybenzoate polyprenyltransferase